MVLMPTPPRSGGRRRSLDQDVDRLVEVHGDPALVGGQGFEGGELRLDERGGHEVSRSALDPPRDDLGEAVEVHEGGPRGARTQQVAVAAA
jgi:hypothetical protein